MGHYCRICGRLRANEKFSGKGHKKHICKDCSGKPCKKTTGSSIDEEVFRFDHIELWNAEQISTEETYSAVIWSSEGPWSNEVDLEENKT